MMLSTDCGAICVSVYRPTSLGRSVKFFLNGVKGKFVSRFSGSPSLPWGDVILAAAMGLGSNGTLLYFRLILSDSLVSF
jgi:hypothetical protein